MQEFSRLIVVVNRRAANAERAERLVRDVERLLGISAQRVDVSGKSPAEIKQAVERLRSELGSRTLLCIGGGDGTVSSVVQAVVTSNKLTAAQKKVVLLPLWGGNANDLAVMLNGYVHLTSIKKVINNGTVAKIYPMRLSLTHKKDAKTTRIATCYASFGATAQATWAMERTAHARDGSAPRTALRTLTREILEAWRAVTEIDSFGVQVGDTSRRLYDRIFVNGPRFGKLQGIPVKLQERKFFEAEASKKNLYFAIYVYKTFLRHTHGAVTDKPVKFVISDPTRAQIDGEVLEVAAHTAVQITINPTPFHALSRKIPFSS